MSADGTSYQIASILENGGNISYTPEIIPTTYADSGIMTYINGNYTGHTGAVTLTGTEYFFPLPSITTSSADNGTLDYATLMSSGVFLTNKATNDIPASYKRAGSPLL